MRLSFYQAAKPVKGVCADFAEFVGKTMKDDDEEQGGEPRINYNYLGSVLRAKRGDHSVDGADESEFMLRLWLR